jgi:hypothetical protein
MMNWVEQIPNEIWTIDEFIDDALCKDVLNSMHNSTRKNLVNTDQMSAKLQSIGINYNAYDYVIYQYDIRKASNIISAIADSLDIVLSKYGQSAPRENLNAMQCFVKSFGQHSHYDLHTESKTKYGDWAFIHFLSDEDSGDLIFPDQQMVDGYLKDNPDQVQVYQDNVDLLASFGEQSTTVGPFVMKPRYNHCILFRTGSAHWANTVSTVNGLTRPTITGWPHASQQMLSDLNRNCNINENFGHG